jgi:hypothetical protein
MATHTAFRPKPWAPPKLGAPVKTKDPTWYPVACLYVASYT